MRIFHNATEAIKELTENTTKIPELEAAAAFFDQLTNPGTLVLFVDGDQHYYIGEGINQVLESWKAFGREDVRWTNDDGYGFVRIFSEVSGDTDAIGVKISVRHYMRFAMGGTSICAPYNCYLVEVEVDT